MRRDGASGGTRMRGCGRAVGSFVACAVCIIARLQHKCSAGDALSQVGMRVSFGIWMCREGGSGVRRSGCDKMTKLHARLDVMPGAHVER